MWSISLDIYDRIEIKHIIFEILAALNLNQTFSYAGLNYEYVDT